MHDEEQIGPEGGHGAREIRVARFRVLVVQPQLVRGVREPLGEHVPAREELVVGDEHAGRHANTSASGRRGKQVSAVCRLQLMTSMPAEARGPGRVLNACKQSANGGFVLSGCEPKK